MNQLSRINEGTSGLARYEAACRAVADAKSVDEVRDFRDQAEAMRAYARQAKNRQLEIDASEIRIRAERRIGELIALQRDAGMLHRGGGDQKSDHRVDEKPSDAPITLAEAGIDKNLADRARKYAAVPKQEFEAILAERRDNLQAENERVNVTLLDKGGKLVRGTFGTGENEWYTPAEHVALARQVLGGIDLDPASSELANRTVGAAKIFTINDNGLNQEWHGRVWLNPPYAQPHIADFCSKMIAEFEAGRVVEAIVLTHNYTDTAWFQAMAHSCNAICFTRGRVRFVSPEGELAAPTQGQAFFYFTQDHETVAAFSDVFESVGFVMERA